MLGLTYHRGWGAGLLVSFVLALSGVGTAQSTRQDPVEVPDEGFSISRSADFSSEDRRFAPTDTLYVRVWSEEVDLANLRRSTTTLTDEQGTKVRESLISAKDGTFSASFSLADLPADGASWTWRAKLKDRAGKRFFPSTEITVVWPVSPPKASFGVSHTRGEAPHTIVLEDLSSGTPTAWLWDFGDGATSTLQNPSHVYLSAGTFTLSLTAINAGGSDTATATGLVVVTAPPPPVADFTASPTSGEAPFNVDFSDLSTGAPTAWLWEFGDGGVSTLQHPAHVYVTPGTFTVSLTVMNAGGASTSSMPGLVVVTAPLLPPVAAFTASPTSGEAPHGVSFSDLSTQAPTSWAWDFGDGGTSTLQHPAHVYATAGTFSVSLTATNAGGSSTSTLPGYVVVTEPVLPPVAEFSASATTGAAPLGVVFSDLSTEAPTSWSWDFGDGGTSTLQNPSHVYLAAGTFTVGLTASNSGGSSSSTLPGLIVVTEPVPPPVAEFSASPTTGEAPLGVAFNDLSTGAPTSWSWDFGDGGTSTLQNPPHIYVETGTFTISLTVTNEGGSSTSSMPGLVVVTEPVLPPLADFTASPTSGVAPLSVAFSDLSTETPTSWAWDFGDGGTSALQDPSHVYLTAGTFSVSLTASNSSGSGTSTLPGLVVVTEPVPPPVAAFTASPTMGETPLSVVFSDLSTETPTSWSWDFGDGGTSTLQDPSHVYLTAGTFTVSLSASNAGGSSTSSMPGLVVVTDPVPPPVADFSASPTTGESPLSVLFSDLSTGAPSSWSWDFGDGESSTLQDPAHVYLTAGTFSVSLTAINSGGSSTSSMPGLVIVTEPVPPPVADFAASPTTGEAPLDVVFSDLSTGAPTSWSWDFGDGGTSTLQHPSHIYLEEGTFTVSLTATNESGPSTLTMPDLVVAKGPLKRPLAGFTATPTTGDAPLSVVFSDLSSRDPSSWSWDFGDGTTSTLQNPSHVYVAAGSYTISLTAANAAGSTTATGTDFVVVTEAVEAPLVSFTATPTRGETPLSVVFSDLSTGAPTSWSWDFGDGETSTLQNPSHTYVTTGSYTVSLSATNAIGSSSFTRPGLIVVTEPVQPPVADFTASSTTSGAAPLSVVFSDLSTGAPTSWSWDFGDGGSSTLQNPSHAYLTAGTFTVSLTASNSGGSSSSTLSDLVFVTEPELPPAAGFSASSTSGEAPLSVVFSDLSTETPTSWSWDFGDGGSSTLQNPAHTYVTAGSFTVSLTATNAHGSGTSTLPGLILVTEPVTPPVADFATSATSGEAPLSVVFSDLSTGTPTSWSWDFGDGGTSTLQNPSHVYVTAGSFTVSLTATNAGGSSTATHPDLVLVTEPVTPPVADFATSATSGEAPLSVVFSDLSTGTPTSWSWDFGDGGTSTLQNPSHVYVTAGSFTVSLTATNAGGSSTATHPDLVLVTEPVTPPVADFATSATSGEAPLSVVFSDLSTGTPTSWSWDFGDGGSSTLQNPSHTYVTAGSFTVSLTATNAGGSSTSTQPDHVVVAAPSEPAFAIEYGMNSSSNGWSQRAIPFADAMARASEFSRVVNGQLGTDLAPLIPLGQVPPLPGEGWPDFFALAPGELVGANLFNNMNGTLPDGKVTPYVLTWEGNGSCRLDGTPVVSEANRTANRVEVFIDPAAEEGLGRLIWVMEASSVTDPVRNVHVWLPGTEGTQPILWQPYVDKLQAMNGGSGPHTWRTLDWNQIRHYGQITGPAIFLFDLLGRITPASPSQGTRRGVCPEYQVALCNTVGASLHFPVPHQTDQMSAEDYETFVRDALTVIRDGSPAVPGVNGGQPFDGLAPDLTVTLELSNEMWNTGFAVNSWMQSQADAKGVTLQQQIAMEIDRVFAIGREVFSGTEAHRLRTYVGGHIADATFLDNILLALDPATHVDSVGCAAYFSPRPEDITNWLVGSDLETGFCPSCPTAAEAIAAARLSIPDLGLLLEAHMLVADTFLNPDGSSPSFEVYEAGQHFVPGFQPWTPAAVEAQSHPDMFDAYVLDLIPILVEEGVDLVNWYSFIFDNGATGGASGPFGHWGNMSQTITLPVPEPYLDEGVPKAAAIYKGPPLRTP